MSELLTFTDRGIYCEKAKLYIDPWKPVNRALITHGHSDHSRYGHSHYLCTDSARPVIKYRLGNINIESVPYGQTLWINGVKFSFHPAGHIVGSAQIKVEYKGQIWVVSGDYKLENDGISEPFEPISCHVFITESTFGLPVYRWENQKSVFEEINLWWNKNKSEGKVSILSAYALGKAQRVLSGLDTSIGPIFGHGAIENTTDILRKQGIKLPPSSKVPADFKRKDMDGAFIIATPSALDTPWMKKFQPYSLAIASGWMGLRGARRRRAADRGFVLSDHADWPSLNLAIEQTGAERIFVTHGYTELFSRWLTEKGYQSGIVSTDYQGELSEIGEA